MQQDIALIKKTLVLIKPYRKRLIVAMISMVLVSAFGSAQAFMIKPLIDKIFVNKDVYQSLHCQQNVSFPWRCLH